MPDWDRRQVTEKNSRPTKIAVRYDPTLTMRLKEKDLTRLKKIADKVGVPTATMGRMLLLRAMRKAPL